MSNELQEIGKTIKRIHEGMPNLVNRVTLIEQKMRTPGFSLPGVESTKFSFGKACHAIKTGDFSRAGYEGEVFSEMRKRALSTGSGSAGYLVPAEAMVEVIEMLRAESVVIRLGARVLDNLIGSPVTWPKITASGVAYWIGENAPITASDATVGQLSLTPKKVAALVKMSNELTILSNPSAESVIRSDIAQGLALAVDLAALRGSGSSNQPLGIAATPGIGSVAIGTNGGDFTWYQATRMIGTLEDANAARGNLGFALHPKVKRVLARERVPQYSGDTGGSYVFPPVMSDAAIAAALGYPFGTTTQIPVNLTKGSSTDCSEVFFGNWADLFLAMWGGLELLASNVAGDATGGAFSSDQLWIRAIQRVDFGLRHAASFCLCSDARVNNA